MMVTQVSGEGDKSRWACSVTVLSPAERETLTEEGDGTDENFVVSAIAAFLAGDWAPYTGEEVEADGRCRGCSMAASSLRERIPLLGVMKSIWELMGRGEIQVPDNHLVRNIYFKEPHGMSQGSPYYVPADELQVPSSNVEFGSPGLSRG